MTPLRMTTKPQQTLERPDGTPAVRRNELSPVGLVEGADWCLMDRSDNGINRGLVGWC